MTAFERGYLANVGTPYPEPGLFAFVVRFFELQRTAVLMTMRKGKVNMGRQVIPASSAGRAANSLANRITLPLLEMEKRWLFRQLAHELPM